MLDERFPQTAAEALASLPCEFRHIVDLVEPGSQVLDLGCGSGDLLKVLQMVKRVRAQGIDVCEDMIKECVGKGLFVFHGDLDEGLADFNDHSVDYVIATNTLQVLHRPAVLLQEMARVGRRCIVSVPNFAHWRVRTHLMFFGSMPVSKRIPFEWYESPNIHHTTIRDFRHFCSNNGLKLLREIDIATLDNGDCRTVNFKPNLMADYAIFMFQRVDPAKE